MNIPESPEGGEEQSFLSHLIELRARLLRAIALILVILVALLPIANHLYTWLAQPLISRLPEGAHMVAIDVASPFFTPVKLALFTAVFAAMPYVLYQLWSFVAPGLYKNEKRLAMPLLVSSVVLFYGGCAFAYFLVLPMLFKFLAGITPQGVSMMTDISHYLDFVVKIFIAFGVCFEVPVAVVILVALGWVTPKQLQESRPYVVLGAFVVAAVLAPPDMMSMVMLGVPMCILYEIGLLTVLAIAKRDAARTDPT